MVNYENGKIYKIINETNDIIYIGSTIQPLSQRYTRHQHKEANRKIILIENYPCNSKEELCKREQQVIEEHDNLLNEIKAYSSAEATKEKAKVWYESNKEKRAKTSKLRYEKNKEEVKKQRKLRYEKTKDEVKKQSKVWYENNKEKRAEQMKKYYEKNKVEILQKQNKECLKIQNEI